MKRLKLEAKLDLVNKDLVTLRILEQTHFGATFGTFSRYESVLGNYCFTTSFGMDIRSYRYVFQYREFPGGTVLYVPALTTTDAVTTIKLERFERIKQAVLEYNAFFADKE